MQLHNNNTNKCDEFFMDFFFLIHLIEKTWYIYIYIFDYLKNNSCMKNNKRKRILFIYSKSPITGLNNHVGTIHCSLSITLYFLRPKPNFFRNISVCSTSFFYYLFKKIYIKVLWTICFIRMRRTLPRTFLQIEGNI